MYEHSSLYQVIRIKKVTAHVVVRKFSDDIAAMPFIDLHYLKVMLGGN